MAQNPDPTIELTSLAGTTRTLDDWATVFNLAIVLLPPRPEASAWIPVIRRLYATFGDADVRTTICIAGPPAMARKILGDAADDFLVFCDPEQRLAGSLGLERLPAFVHIRQDTSLVNAAQGWSVTEWQRVADEMAKAQHWTSPQLAAKDNPAPTAGWAL